MALLPGIQVVQDFGEGDEEDGVNHSDESFPLCNDARDGGRWKLHLQRTRWPYDGIQ